MSEPKHISSKTSLPVDQIQTANRLRPVSAAGVAAIVASIGEIGQITSPILVRQKQGPQGIYYVVLDGSHRLAAAVELGWTEVPVRVFECTDDVARLVEIDGNLAGAELNPLDTAVFLATRKAVYERLHPETKAGVAGAKRRWTDASDIVSFASTTAEKFGLSKRHVERMVAAGARLGPDEIAKLRSAPRGVTLKDLQVIAKLTAAPERYEVVDMLAEGKAKSAADAVKQIAEPNRAPVNPVDAEWLAIMRAWSRAGKAARRIFIEEAFSDLSPLVIDEAEKRDAAEIAALQATGASQ